MHNKLIALEFLHLCSCSLIQRLCMQGACSTRPARSVGQGLPRARRLEAATRPRGPGGHYGPLHDIPSLLQSTAACSEAEMCGSSPFPQTFWVLKRKKLTKAKNQPSPWWPRTEQSTRKEEEASVQVPALSLSQTKSDCLNHKSLCFRDYFPSKKVLTTQIFRKQAIHHKATTSICMVCEKAFTTATASVGQCWITSAGHGRPLLRSTMSGRQRGPGCIPLVSGTLIPNPHLFSDDFLPRLVELSGSSHSH